MNNLLESIEACSDSQVADRILGCAYGQALGDAYGLSTEFLSKAEVSQFYPDTSIPVPFPSPKQTQHSSRWKTGDWTDDTDQWLLVLETLLEHDSTPNVFARKLTLWVRQGFPDLDDFGGLGLGINVAKVELIKFKFRKRKGFFFILYNQGYLFERLHSKSTRNKSSCMGRK